MSKEKAEDDNVDVLACVLGCQVGLDREGGSSKIDGEVAVVLGLEGVGGG